jgi:GNAT superfamily N-acetyltransferase
VRIRANESCAETNGGEILRIYVHPDEWRCGIGHELMHAAFERFRHAGFDAAYVWSPGTLQACGFYEKCGFQRTGELIDVDVYGGIMTTEIRYRCML